MSIYNAREGWTFERTDNGDVRITGRGEAVVLDSDTWQSAVASVSADGENGETFSMAERLHMGAKNASL